MIILRTTDLALIAAIACFIFVLRSGSAEFPATPSTSLEFTPTSWSETLPATPDESDLPPLTPFF